jgi:lysophospholipase L1-like esterase
MSRPFSLNRPVARAVARSAAWSATGAGGDPSLRSVAFMGDSITAQSVTGLVNLNSNGYPVWARAFGGSRWDFEPNGAALTFATGGFDTFQVAATHLPQVLASNADTAFLHCGTNDFSDGTSSQDVADEILSMWLALRAANIRPIGSTILPVVGNATKSTWIAATNEIIRSHAAANGIALCDWTNVIDVGTNTGVSNTTFLPDNIHPGTAGALLLGRFLSDFLTANYSLAFDPWAAPGALLTRNPAFAGSSGQPTSWNVPVVPVSGTLNSKSLVADSETGGNWWQMDVTQGAATGFFVCQLDFVGQASVVGKTVYAITDVEVVSGSFMLAQLRCAATSNTYDLLNAQALPVAEYLVAADGVLTLRTPPMVVPSGNTYYTPTLSFAGTGVIRFRRAALYEV